MRNSKALHRSFALDVAGRGVGGPPCRQVLVSLVVICAMSVGSVHAAKVIVVCPDGAQQSGCGFTGDSAIQTAIDKAAEGDTVLLKAGVYRPRAYRDLSVTLSHWSYVVRGFLTIDRKAIQVIGEPGAILDGSTGPETSAIVVYGGQVAISNLIIRNFRAVDPVDTIVDGSGIYIIDADAAVRDVVIERHAKMGLASRGSALVTAANLRIQEGYVGVMAGESSQLRLCNSVIKNNSAAGAAVYFNSSAAIYNSVLDGHHDDGLYAAGNSTIFATNSLILNSKPFAVRVIDNARAFVGYSVLFGNVVDESSPEGKQLVTFGEGMVKADPKADADYRLPARIDGDPEVRRADGGKSWIGLQDTAGCARASRSMRL